ncbi:NHD2, partial [Symbiodinium necroappetens]
EFTHGSPLALTSLLGVSSAVVDNVPLVQASIQMFKEPMDDPLWQLVALAAGT